MARVNVIVPVLLKINGPRFPPVTITAQLASLHHQVKAKLEERVKLKVNRVHRTPAIIRVHNSLYIISSIIRSKAHLMMK